MPFNGSGTFVSLSAPDFPAVPGTLILASAFNANMNDVFNNGLTKCVTRDGQSPATANLPMGGFRHTGVGNAVADTDYAAFGQVAGLRGTMGAVNWDSRTTLGIFDVAVAALQAPATNFPPTLEVGQLLVYAQGANIVQVYTTAYRTYIRRRVAAVWTTWSVGWADYNPDALTAAATVNLADTASNHIIVSGNTNITSFGNVQAGVSRLVRFTGTPLITHSAGIVLPNNANFQVAAGDVLHFISLGATAWRCIGVHRQTSNSIAMDAISTPGLVAITGAGTVASRTLTQPAAGLTITNPAGTAGDPTFALANDLAALEGLGSTGIACRTAADTWAQRTLTAPAAGLTITNPAGIAGNPIFALADDLAGLEGMAGTGLVARTAANTYAQRTLTGTANKITVTDGDGVAANPTLTIPDSVTLVTPTVTNRIELTGGQIAFPSTQVASGGANTLDEYEEGSFTPAMAFGGGTTGITYSTQAGFYCKIGEFVWTQLTIVLTNKGSSTGAATITGFPFSNNVQSVTVGVMGGNANMASLTSPVNGTITGTTVSLFDHGATGQTAIDDTNFANNTAFRFTLCYGSQ